MTNADVIVIGAGYAGMTAAKELFKAGKKVLVLEARVRIGGRCQTGSFDGEVFDFGGHWIGALQPRVREMILAQGLKLKNQYDQGTHIMRIKAKQYQYVGNISTLNSFGDILADCAKMVEIFDEDISKINLEEPHKCPFAKEWDSITVKDWQDKNMSSQEAITLMNFLLWTIFTVQAHQISYFWWLYYLKQGHGYTVLSDIRGGAQQDKCVGGLQQVVENIAKEIGGEAAVKLRTPVIEVIQKDGIVTCKTSNGDFCAPLVICTAPPIVLNDIKWTPELPSERRELNEKFKPGRVIKIYVIYEKNWWREMGFSGEMLSDEEPVTLYYDATTEKLPALIGFICAHNAIKWGEKSSEELHKAISEQLVREFGPIAASPRKILTRVWLVDDVYCKGAYAGGMGLNTLSKYGGIIRQPFGQIHWAGTETALDWCGYFEGAVESGIRAAHECLMRFRRSKL